MEDTKNNIQIAFGLSATLSGVTPAKGNIVDGSGFESITYALQTGVVTVAGVAGIGFEVQESDTTADAAFTPVADKDLIGLESAMAITLDTQDSVAIGTIGYIGDKRYTRIVATGTTNTNAIVNVVAIKSRAKLRPPALFAAANIAAT